MKALLPQAMQRYWNGEEDFDFENMAARLGKEANREYVDQLTVDALSNGPVLVRSLAVSALGYCIRDGVLDVLVRIAQDESNPSSVRAEAFEQLGYRGCRSSDVEEAILVGLRDRDDEVCFFAIFAAGMCRVEIALPNLLRIRDAGRSGAVRYGSLSDEASTAIERIGL